MKRSDSAQGSFLFVVAISCVATIGGFLFGFDSGVINGTVKGLQLAFESDSAGAGFNVASMLLGCAGGAFFAGTLADKYGRRSLLIVAAALFIISAWGSGVAMSSFEFVIYRIIGGIGVGAASVMAPAYISEIAPAKYRGTLASVQQVAILFGLTMAFFSNYLIADMAGSATEILWLDCEAWRWMFWIELIPAVIFFVALMFIPESPRYLVAAGKKEVAIKVLARLYGKDSAGLKADNIENSLGKNRHKPKLSDLVDKNMGKVRPIVWVGIGLAVFQQLVGINVVFYYGAVLWQAVGFSEADALMINVIGGVVSLSAVAIALISIDKIGRKPLLVTGSVGMAVALSIMVYVFANSGVDLSGNLILGSSGIVALIAANSFIFFFNLSWGPVMWVMLGEMFPNQIRGSALAIAGLAQWGANFLVTITFPIMLGSIGLAGVYGFYAFFAFVSVFFVLQFVNETKGVELEDMKGYIAAN
jgi:SP family sugar:H+ symporter-like MFS transporter